LICSLANFPSALNLLRNKLKERNTVPILEEILFFPISQLLKSARITGEEEVKTFSVLLFSKYFSFLGRHYNLFSIHPSQNPHAVESSSQQSEFVFPSASSAPAP